MPVPLFSFIIVNYHSAALLPDALASIRAFFSAGECESIIVNNDSSEAADVAALSAPDIRVIQAPANGGFARANNLGVREAAGDILVFLNPDARLKSGNWRALQAVFSLHLQAVIGLRLVTPSGKPEAWCAGKRPNLWRLIWNKWPLFTDRIWQSDRLCAVDWVSGAALAVRRETFAALGGFDERFFLYFEDVDLGVRARECGYPVLWYPYIAVEHLGGTSHASDSALKAAYFDGQRRYFAKHATGVEYQILSVLQSFYRFFV